MAINIGFLHKNLMGKKSFRLRIICILDGNELKKDRFGRQQVANIIAFLLRPFVVPKHALRGRIRRRINFDAWKLK